MKNTDERICIIGGGPAGVTAAMYLQKKGYKNYVVYEKDDHVGGKCYSPTVEMGQKGSEKRTIELGAIMGAKTYYAVHDAEVFGGTVHDGPAMGRIYKNKDGKEIFPFDPKHNILNGKIFSLIHMKNCVKKLAKLMKTKYKGYDVCGHRGVASGKYEGLEPSSQNMPRIKGENPNLKDLCLPFTEFCKINNLEPVMRVWIAPFTSFGYGYFDEMPAAYVLKYLDVETTLEFVAMRLWTWKDGTMSIFENVNKKLANPAVLNTEATKVERKDNKVYVTVKKGDESHVETFDKIIVTTPLDYFDKYADASKEEKELFAKIVHEEYISMATRQEIGKCPQISAYIFDNMTPETRGHLMVYYHRWSDIPDQPIITYTLRNHQGMESVSYDYARATTIDDMKKCGCEVKKVEIEKEWYYCPHVYSEDYASGWYDKVEAMQGNRNTYYAGEVMSFGDMEETCEYSKDLVDRFF
ncbi:MAG: FAD-dependent oxidoreductase [Bacilli bacterium]